MKKSIITKKIIAKSLKDLMLEKDFKKISTADIMNHAGIRRQTFYNHFSDKYELVEWIFKSELHEQLSDNVGYQHWKTTVLTLLFYLEKNKTFYQRAFEIDGQNSFEQFFCDQCKEVIKATYQDTHPNDAPLKESKLLQLLTEYHALAFSHFIKEHIDDNVPLERYHEFLCYVIDHQFNDRKDRLF
ncbi:transcriptional regulator, TetR family [Granulicatella balaenopterae]|uniref:Transcriptional regulator, TetR family n=1 Tax=Granulicatella balaenopterae TaxID=137733 RepID=A0A1H9N3V5_9LACT|nr:dihydroxyacetone kinase transcriptional activator DhaS [Granulicatella balaenopterae]SER30558.1 transcriptional regulator, TetR family [Granulicatella balaenopterae]